MNIRVRVLSVAALFALSATTDALRALTPIASGPAAIGRPDGADAQKRVLVLHAAREGQPAFAAFDAALDAALAETLAGRVDVYHEYLDAGRFVLTDAYLSTFRAFLRDKHKERPDVVVALALDAVRFMDRYGEELFPHTPVLFVATTQSVPAYGTSVFSDTDWNGSLKLALALQPATKTVFVVTGASGFDRQALAGAQRQLLALEERLDFVYLTGLPVEELEQKVAALPADSIVYFVSMTLDGSGHRFEGTGPLERIAAVASVPTYVQSETNFGHGVMGGRLWSSRPWGLKSAEIIKRILEGEAPDTIPPSNVDIYSDRLDWRQMQRWKVDEVRVPAGTQILFREPTVWQQYGRYIVGASALVILQSGLIAGLLVQRARRRRVESSLRESELRFREAAEQNQDLVGRVLNAQEEERGRIARDLHDDVSQRLAALSIMLSELKRKVGKPGSAPDVDQTITTLQDRTSLLAQSIRNLSHELHPSVLEHTGLVATLRRHCSEVEELHHVKVKFSAAEHLEPLEPEVEICLFRVTQEGLNNAVRHARAHAIGVQLVATREGVELRVVDDGIGFRTKERSGSGLGLRSIDERVRQVRGHVIVDSQPGQGTMLRIQIPIAALHAESVREPERA